MPKKLLKAPPSSCQATESAAKNTCDTTSRFQQNMGSQATKPRDPAGASRYTPVAGHTRAVLGVFGRKLRLDYSRPLRIEVGGDATQTPITVPDRQLQTMLVLWAIVILARLKMARRDS